MSEPARDHGDELLGLMADAAAAEDWERVDALADAAEDLEPAPERVGGLAEGAAAEAARERVLRRMKAAARRALAEAEPDEGPAPARFATASEWAPYQGPSGGGGWKNLRTGEVRYQEARPGEGEGGGPGKPGEGDRSKSLERFRGMVSEAGEFCSTDPLHVFVHECMHKLHYDNGADDLDVTPQQFRGMLASLRPQELQAVSRYGRTDLYEFVAEVGTQLVFGEKPVPPAVVAVYKKLGGVMPDAMRSAYDDEDDDYP